MVLFSSMVDCKKSFPPIQLQDHPTKALGKDMAQTIQSRDSLCEEVLSIFDLLGQSRVLFEDVMALLFVEFSHIRRHIFNMFRYITFNLLP